MNNRVMPSSLEAEQTLIGCILNSTDRFIEADTILNSEDFYVDKHKKIYETIKKLCDNSVSVDTVTVVDNLKKKGILEECGGITYLSNLETGAVNYSSIENYARIVKEKSDRRALVKTGSKLMEDAFEKEDVKEAIEDAEKCIFNVSASKNITGPERIDTILEKAFVKLEKRCKNGGGLVGISTGFKGIDDITGGLKPGELVIVAARPSMGKTAFALNIAQSASRTSSVIIFSLEMETESLLNRMISSSCMIKMNDIQSGTLTDDQFVRIMKRTSELGKRNLYIDDKSTMLSDIKALCRKQKLQKGLDVIVIDYLQLIRTTMKANQREQEVSYISKELKSLAKELNITVIALSQLSRAPEARNDHRPMLSDLRESGSIEQDADIIHFIYRDAYYNNNKKKKGKKKDSEGIQGEFKINNSASTSVNKSTADNSGNLNINNNNENNMRKDVEYNKKTDDIIAEIITAKNRNGQTKTNKLNWIGEYQRFTSADVIKQ
ncbi:replicative DNA helicase [Clostridium butyricum]|uniref:replicative DNA helicase n=1 Tax=Clostridium butyricum TaxID=1492 RepID=UPI00129A6631|nr:replicative DNA helicase [Clostridium butyricum]MBO1685590.1 replicative DNA helicase [Clostridium butyricum]MBZ0311231.1 replicative DNA helicase [Clostridium butyricum]MDI9209400.1 replicative DNA helicase [Clostridium butyricum]QGH22720.1 replicative DNA helicase [Clostridium butyricum]QGH26762.1 replicative DNA helicase [Clostridium butyricum]